MERVGINDGIVGIGDEVYVLGQVIYGDKDLSIVEHLKINEFDEYYVRLSHMDMPEELNSFVMLKGVFQERAWINGKRAEMFLKLRRI